MMKGFLKTFLVVNLSLYMAFAQSQEVYKAATEGNILPIAFKDENGLLIGLNVEIMNRIAELEGFKVEFFEATWEDICLLRVLLWLRISIMKSKVLRI